MAQPVEHLALRPQGAGFFAFLGALFFSRLGDQVLLFLVPLVVFQTTGSTAWAGWAFAIEAFPRFFSLPICGALCDRISPVRLMRWSQLLRAVACVAGLMGNALLESVGWLIGLSAICGVMTMQGAMAREVILPRAFQNRRFESVLAYSQMADQMGAVLGPVFAAALLAFVPWQGVVAAAALLFCGADLMLFYWRRTASDIDPRGQAGKTWLSAFRIAFAHILRTPTLRRLVIQAAGVNLVVGITSASCAAMFTGEHRRSSGDFAYLQMAGAVATVLILLGIARARMPVERLGVAAYASMVLGGIVTAWSSTPAGYAAGYLLVIGFDKMFNIYLRSTRQRAIPIDDYGKTTGLMTLLNNLTQPLSGVILGAFATTLSTSGIILALSVSMGALGWLSLLETAGASAGTARSGNGK